MMHILTSNPLFYYLTALVFSFVIGTLLEELVISTVIIMSIAVFYIRRIRTPKKCSKCNEVH